MAVARNSIAPSSQVLIEAKAFSVRFGKDVIALQDVDLAIHAGEVIVLVGPSGCGKTTLLNSICGLLPPEARLSGALKIAEGTRLGYMPQKDALLPWRSVLGNVEVGPELRGVGKAERRERANELLELVGLGRFRDHYPHQLSGGMRQRVSLARTLAYEPDLILMDEPFGALDAFTRTALQEELLRINDKTRLTVLLITHDLSEAIVLGQRVFVMTNRPGRVLDVFPIDLPEPRSALRLQGTEAYQHYFQRMWNVLMVESDATRRQVP